MTMQILARISRSLSCILVAFIAALTLPGVSLADKAYDAEVGTCTKAKTDRQIQRAKHLFFTIAEGKELWKELGGLRLQRKKVKLIDTKLELKDDVVAIWKMRFDAAEKTVTAQKAQVEQLHLQRQRLDKQIEDLTTKWNKAEKESAKYKGQRYEFLVWGAVGGVVVTAVVVGAVVIAAAAAK